MFRFMERCHGVEEDRKKFGALLLNRKHLYTNLRDSQRFKSVEVRRNPPHGHRYRFDFELALPDTARTKMYLYQRDLSQVPRNKVLLWVCSLRCQHADRPRTGSLSKLRWHFSEVETRDELLSKHKGIIACLHDDDLLVAAGEIILLDDSSNDETASSDESDDVDEEKKCQTAGKGCKVVWNNMTGALKRLMFRNEHIWRQMMATGSQKRMPVTFVKYCLASLLASCHPRSIIFDRHLLYTHASPTSYEYCRRVQKYQLCHRATLTRVCVCA